MKRYKVIHSSKFLSFISFFGPIEAALVTFAPFVFSRSKVVTPSSENHEAIHVYQQQEISLLTSLLLAPLAFFVSWQLTITLLILAWLPLTNPFYTLYVIFYLFGVIKYRDTNFAYDMIPFEQESYANEENLNYLKARFAFSWVKYLHRG